MPRVKKMPRSNDDKRVTRKSVEVDNDDGDDGRVTTLTGTDQSLGQKSSGTWLSWAPRV
jgi:hypothetical protein